MNVLQDLLNPNKVFTPIRIRSAQVKGEMKYESEEEVSSSDDDDPERFTANYAEKYVKEEAIRYADAIKMQEDVGNISTVDTIDTMVSYTTRAEINAIKEENLQIFNKYTFNTHLRTEPLTIDSYKEEILSLINTNTVVIVQGPTGCGKSTQVPQFILDDCKANNICCNIVVTQPRRIAAISLARRVCEERGWAMGSVCGYQVALEKERSFDTVLNYVTTGILLQKLITVKNLHEFTHVIVDEVHERNEDMDFLLLLIRKFLYTNSLNIKVVLMSATFDTDKFSQYFWNNSRMDIDTGAPAVFITNKNKYQTQIFYADQLTTIRKIPDYDVNDAKIDNSLYDLLVFLVEIFDRLDETDPQTNNKIIGNVLVFLPGIYEIEEAYDRLQKASKDKNTVEWYILPLHSSITNDEQRKAFYPPPTGRRKIILSTNIAESSITVNDIVYVIDFCLTKALEVDPDTQYQSLKLQWASHVNCTQRAGRVGRVCDGRVYRLVPRSFYEKELAKTTTPAILRSPLDRVVLACKLLDLNEPPKAVLALAMDPPNLTNIEATIWKLKECGALLSMCKGVKMISDGDLTFLGSVMASLPIDVHLAKLIVLGHMFSCLEECTIMAAGCSLPNIFTLPFQERLKAFTNKLIWADGSCSDLITYLNLYRVWERNKRTNSFNNKARGEYEWARNNFISLRCLREWALLVKEIQQRLQHMGITETTGPGRVVLSHAEIPLVLKVVISGAFYPNYFKRSADCGQVNEREAVRELGGRDPFNTVYFKNMDPKHPGPLYARRIKQLLSDCGNNMQIIFDYTSKVYVQFLKHTQYEAVTIDGQQFISTIPGKICMEVYRAVRRRQLKIPSSFPVLSVDAGRSRAKQLGLDDKKEFKHLQIPSDELVVAEGPILPTCDVQYIKIQISSKIDAGHFWAQHDDEQTLMNLAYIEKQLNSQQLCPVTGKVGVGEIYAALYESNNMYYRCRVACVNPFGKMGILMAQVIFIDYGDTNTIPLEKIKQLPSKDLETKPAQAMECVLNGIQPSLVLNPRSLWTENVNKHFDESTNGVSLFGKVYSVVNGVVHLELFKQMPNSAGAQKISLNQWLIEKGYAQVAEESYLSKLNHEKRLQMQSNDADYYHKSELSVDEDILPASTSDVQPPSDDECDKRIVLSGPFSPLEMQIYSCVETGMAKRVTIEGGSVNAALLDSNPEDPHERLVVAGYINQNTSGSSLILRHTSIMPNIPGFPMLMSLIFCPMMEPKPTESGSHFASILCGLGTYENSKKSVYPAHDMVVTLDTKLEKEDLIEINEMRYTMNTSIKTMQENYKNVAPGQDMITLQRDIKKRIIDILKKRRTSIPRTASRHAGTWRKFEYAGNVLLPTVDDFENNVIWPLHWTMTLNQEVEDSDLENNITAMQDMATRTTPMNEITCKCCNIVIYSVHEMRVHLGSEVHKVNAGNIVH